MGTNFFAAADVCECCGRGREQWHIGKSFRTLRSYQHAHGPFGVSIKTLKDWEAVLVRQELVIMDEYGEMWDKWKFLDEWRRRGKLELSYEQQLNGGYTRDSEGFILYGSEFS